MLERIEIRNFQSHKATNLDLSSSVNTLQGNSDCGKSAVMRALNWLIFNPAGDYFVSNWAKKGKTISAPCEVTLYVNGYKVTRRRDKDFNGYMLDDQVFEATRNSVPPQILSVLGLGEVNLQKQLDPPFLLSMSPGDVSRYVNNLVNLSKIDTWVTAINGRTRRLTQDVDAGEKKVEDAQKLVDSYSWVHDLELLSENVSELDHKISYLKENFDGLKNSLEFFEQKNAELSSLTDVDKALELLSNAEESRLKRLEVGKELSLLKEQIENYEKRSSELEEIPDIESVEKILAQAKSVDNEREKIKTKLVSISCEVAKYLSIKIPDVPEAIFSLLEKLERYKNVRTRLEEGIYSLKQDLGTHNSNSIIIETVEKEIGPILWELDKMVCPVCGRKGLHED